jgi:UDP-glucose-4-epimerase GalE
MAKLLITGAAGYVGGHTLRHLLATGMPAGDIVAFDNLERGHLEFIPEGVTLVRGDLRERATVDMVFRSHDVDALLHFAAYAYVGESMQEPARYFENNLCGGLNLVDAARKAGCRRIVFSSTCAVYGTPAQLPMTEDLPARPESPYGESKRAFEEILGWYARAHGVRSVCLRYFNAAGAAYGIGERHEPETHVIPLVLEAALGRRPAFTVNGDDYPTADGTCIRDYVHVVDLAEAHARALRLLATDGFVHDRINLGTGRAASVREVVDMAKRVSGRDIPTVIGPRRPGDPAALYADPSRAQAVLGWRARFGIEEIVRDAWAWHSGQRVHVAERQLVDPHGCPREPGVEPVPRAVLR